MIKAVVWDLGGVLVDNPNLRNFWQDKKNSKKLRDEFGSGKLSIKEFVKKGSRLLTSHQKEFLERYKKIYFSIELIKEGFNIYKKIPVDKYILSDTNPIHGNFLKEKFKQIFKISKGAFLSYELGFRKDQPKTFKFLIKKLRVSADEILLIDDKSEVIERAKKFGIKTILCDNPKKLKTKINKLKNEM